MQELEFLSFNRIWGLWLEEPFSHYLVNRERLNGPSIFENQRNSNYHDQALITQYLKTAFKFTSHRGYSEDIFNKGELIPQGQSIYSDGHWFWFHSAIYYFENGYISIPEKFLLHIRTQNYHNTIDSDAQLKGITKDLRKIFERNYDIE